MAQCPNCNAAIWKGQRYCSTCDSYLPKPEEEDHFCPRCGIRVDPQQEFCHKCNLLEMAGASSQPMTRARRLPPWVTGVFIGTGLVIVVLLLIFLVNKSSGPPLLIGPPPAPLASGQTPATSPPRVETAPSAPTAPAVKELSGPSAPEPLSPPELKTPVPSPPLYFVKAHALALRDGPARSAPQIDTLDFKDEVELLETSGGWGRIREVRRDIVGWSNMRYLEPVQADQQ
jgi:Double zinc ribbon/Bacterial SH3 domain